MSNLKTKELSKIGYTNDQARSLVINIISKHFKHTAKADILTLLSHVKHDPQAYLHDEVLGRIAATFADQEAACNFQSFELLEQTGQLKNLRQ